MLATKRLLLRPWQPADAPHVWQLVEANRERLRPTFPKTLAAVGSPAGAESFISSLLPAWQERTGFHLGMWAGNRCTGFISLFQLDWSVPRAELAYLLAAEFEGRGLMAEALPALLGWAFHDLALERVSCRIAAANERSLNVIKRLGFQREGTLRHDFRNADGQLTDLELYSLLPTELPPVDKPV